MTEFISKLWALARPYKNRVLLGVIAGILAGLAEPLMIATITFVYGVIFPDQEPSAATTHLQSVPGFLRDWLNSIQQSITSGARAHPGAAIALVAMIPGVLLVRGVLSYLNIYFLQWSAIRAIIDLRVRLFSHLLQLSASFFSRASSGELISRIMSDTQALQGILSNAAAVTIKDPVTLAGLLGWLLWKQPALTLLSLVVLPACMVPIIVYSRKARSASRSLQAHAAELTQTMGETFTGFRVVKAYGLESRAEKEFRGTARKFIGFYMRIIRSIEIPGPMLEFLGAIGVALVFLYLMIRDAPRPASADFLAVIAAIFAMYRPLKNLTRLHNQLEQARAASERVFELLSIQNTVPEPASPRSLKAAGADITFDHLEFSYGEKVVLQDINLTVKAGKLVALVGASGSGKTSLTNLLLRFYDPQAGAVRIGDTDIREVSTADLRSQIAVVTQETILFNDTIRNNIALGRPGATEEEIISAARHAHAHDFILEKPNGYDTVVGEKGVLLSGGQRQRLAIARAVLKDAPILILDEATNALDAQSERAVQTALDELMKGRTTICIAHRLSTILHANLIVVMDQGRIVETGTHGELIQRDGVYRRLHQLSSVIETV